MHELDDILKEIATKRSEQDAQWGGPQHDDLHTPAQWSLIIQRHLNMANHAISVRNTDSYQARLLNVAAVAVAAIQSLRRQLEPLKPCIYDSSHNPDTTFITPMGTELRRSGGGL